MTPNLIRRCFRRRRRRRRRYPAEYPLKIDHETWRRCLNYQKELTHWLTPGSPNQATDGPPGLGDGLRLLVDPVIQGLIRAATNYTSYSTICNWPSNANKKCLMSSRTQYRATAPHLVTNNPGTQTIQIRLLGITSPTTGLLGRHSCECLLVGELVTVFR